MLYFKTGDDGLMRFLLFQLFVVSFVHCRKVAKVLASETFGALLDSPLPPFRDLIKDVSTSSKVCLTRLPCSVQPWRGFVDKVRAHRLSLDPDVLAKESCTMPQRHRKHIFTDEADIQHAFLYSAGDALDQLFDGSVVTTRLDELNHEFGEGSRTPDCACVRVAGHKMSSYHKLMVLDSVDDSSDDESLEGEDLSEEDLMDDDGTSEENVASISKSQSPSVEPSISESSTRINGVPIAVGDFKRTFLSGRKNGLSTDLVERYHVGESMAVSIILQITGYHFHYHCKFGIISTYEMTWVTCLDNHGILHISPAYEAATCGIDSTLNQLFYVLCVAARKVQNHLNMWVPPCVEIPINAKDAKIQKQKERLSGNTHSLWGGGGGEMIEFIRWMAKSGDRATWQGRFVCNGTLVAVKIYTDAYGRDKEVLCYEALRQLQGTSIPILLDPNYPVTWNRRMHGFVLSWVGEQFGGNYLTLPTKAILQLRKITLDVHNLGVVHKDLRPENTIYNHTTDKLYILDFSHAETVETVIAEEFEKGRREDLQRLEELIACSATPQAQERVRSTIKWLTQSAKL